MIIVDIIIFILLLLSLILLAVLFIPIEYSARGHRDEDTFAVSANISWFFKGLILSFIKQKGSMYQLIFKALGFEVNQNKKQESEYKKKKEKKKEENSKKNAGRFLNKKFIEQVLKALNDVLKYLKPRILDIEGKFGFDDPSLTGLSCILVYNIPLRGQNYNINITPAFDEEVLEGKFNIQGRIVIAVILWIALKFVLSPPVRNIILKRKEGKKLCRSTLM